MAAGQRERRELQALVGTIGPESADTLLGYPPPAGWADVATKHDLNTQLRWMVGLVVLVTLMIIGTGALTR